jgi:3-deoxy-D-manno-octulosonic-acid transferase
MKAFIWLHAASLGDVKAIESLISHLSPSYQLYLSTVTSSGQAQAKCLKQQYPMLILKQAPIYFPFSPWRAWYAMHKTQRPQLLILEYLELWPHWIWAWERLGVKIIVIDGKLTSKTTRFAFCLKPFFRKIHLFLAQSREDAKQAHLLGVSKAEVIGFGKYDSIASKISMQQVKNNHQKSSILLTIACLAKDEEAELIDTVQAYYHQLQAVFTHACLCIAPRDINRSQSLIKRLKALKQLPVHVYPLDQSNHIDIEHPCIYVVNAYGLLDHIYAQSRYALIAGSFGQRNGQNIVEALCQKCFVLVGPQSQKIEQEKELLRAYPQLGVEVKTMNHAMTYLLIHQPQWDDQIDISALIQAQLLGASQKQAQIISSLITSE